MSFCRWSSDSYRCDIYAYESDAGFEVHVAANRHILPDDAVAPTWDDPDFVAKHARFHEIVSNADLEPIGLPHDGQSYILDTEEEMLACLAMLAEAGYNVPAHLLA